MRLCRPELSLALFTLGCSPFNGGLCDVMAGAISGVIPFNDDDDDVGVIWGPSNAVQYLMTLDSSAN